MLEVTTYISESDCTTDLEKQLYKLARDYQELSQVYDKERKKRQIDNYNCMPVAVNGLSEELQHAIFDINQIKDGINSYYRDGEELIVHCGEEPNDWKVNVNSICKVLEEVDKKYNITSYYNHLHNPKNRTYDFKERKKKVNYAIDREYIESISGTSPISDDLVEIINDEIWNNCTILDLIHDVIQQHVD